MPGTVDEIVLTAEEHRNFPFFPPAVGGRMPPAHVQASLEAKGLVRVGVDGRRWVTVHGDRVRMGIVPSKIVG